MSNNLSPNTELLIEKVCSALKDNNMNSYFVKTKEDAVSLVLPSFRTE